MNQVQRQFLLTSIETRYKQEREALNKQRPKAPNLNNYLTAAILDGSFKLRPAEAFRSTIRDRVVGLGPNEALLETKTNRWGNDESKYADHVVLPAELIFELPPGYQEAIDTYERLEAEYDAKMKALVASFEAMKIKVQLGSDKALQPLIDQADTLCSMSLTDSSKLFITDAGIKNALKP